MPQADTAVVYGVVDLPDRQGRELAVFRPDIDGSLLVYGTGGTGKTVTLRTLAAAFGHQVNAVSGKDYSVIDYPGLVSAFGRIAFGALRQPQKIVDAQLGGKWNTFDRCVAFTGSHRIVVDRSDGDRHGGHIRIRRAVEGLVSECVGSREVVVWGVVE